MPFAHYKIAGQSAYPCSLISVYVVPCLDNVSSCYTHNSMNRSYFRSSVAYQVALRFTGSIKPEDIISHDEAKLFAF